MQTVSLKLSKKDNDFLEQVCQCSGQLLHRCYQCGKCTAGCPVAPSMDLAPNQVIRMIQLGIKEEVLKSNTIWLCAFCSTCTVRCPRNVDLALVMETLRIITGREGKAAPGRARNVQIFTGNFLNSVKRYGRMFEFGTMVGYNLKSGRPFQESDTGFGMLQRKKLKLMPEKLASADEIKRIFEEVTRAEEESR